MTSLEQSKELMRRVREIVLGHHVGVVIETTPADARVLRMYWRIASLLEGACLLLDARLPEEAIMLGREMFTDSLHLMEIASRGPNRAPLILGLASKALGELENLGRQARSLGVENQRGMEEIQDHVAKERKKIEGYRLRHGIGALETLRHEKQLATEHGRLGEYLDFEFAHRMVHVPDIAQAGRTRKRDAEVVEFQLRNPDDEFIARVSAFIMQSALHAHKAVASVFDWTDPSREDIDRVLTEIEQLFPAKLSAPDESL
jgi:hypothetical protein